MRRSIAFVSVNSVHPMIDELVTDALSVPGPTQSPSDPAGLVTERLEAEICTLAGHLAAATCRWLELVAEFDAREAWRAWEQRSCAGWLSWKCGLSLTTAHEHLRVARTLRGLPGTRAAFAAGRLSYAKVRAITRVATSDNEDDWVACALGCTAAQLDRLTAACRKVTRRQSETRADRERLTWRWDDDGMLIVTGRLAPEHGAAFVAAIEAAQHAAWDSGAGSSAEDSHRDEQAARPGCTRPEALTAIVGHALADGPQRAEVADAGRGHQVVIHVDGSALNDGVGGKHGHDATGGRCYVDNGPSIHPKTLRRVGCGGGTAFTVHHGPDGTPLDVGRASRTVPAKLRRAVLDRARGRCQFPGCEHRSWLQLHHVHHWIDGGGTNYANLAVLCGRHHRAHHAGHYTIGHDRREPGHFAFHLPDGTTLEHAPAFPPLAGDITDQHTAAIAPDTIQPAWPGDPLNLDYAVEIMAQTRTRTRTRAAHRTSYEKPTSTVTAPDDSR